MLLCDAFLREAADVQTGQRTTSHRIDIAEGVRRGDPAEGARVVHDGGDEIEGLDQRQIVGQTEDPGIVGGIESDEDVRARVRAQAEPPGDLP